MIGKANLPQSLPVSASIELSQILDVKEVCAKLEEHELLKFAVGLSPKRLYLTGHLGSKIINEDLQRLGFSIDRSNVMMHTLTRSHDTSLLNPDTLQKAIARMQVNGSRVINQYVAKTRLAGPNALLQRGELAENLICMMVPSMTRTLAFMFTQPRASTAVTKFSFDDLMLGTYAHTKRIHQCDLGFFLKEEFGYLGEVIQALYPDIHPVYHAWAESYIVYLIDQSKQGAVIDLLLERVGKVFMEISPPKETVKPESAVEAASAETAPTQEPAVQRSSRESNEEPTLKDRMQPLLEEAGVPTESPLRDELEFPEVKETTRVRYKAFFEFETWRVPRLSELSHTAHFPVPYWVLKFTSISKEDEGKWLVQTPTGILRCTEEQYQYMFEKVK